MGNLTHDINQMDVPELEKTLEVYKNSTVKYYIGTGYILKQLKKKAEYDDWDAFCRERYGMDKTAASRCMNANTRYSLESSGQGMELNSKYKGLNKSVLIAMLSLPEEMEDQVTPDMKVADVREMVKQHKQEQQIHTDSILEQPKEVARTYDNGDEIEGNDLALIKHLVKQYIEQADMTWVDLIAFDISGLEDCDYRDGEHDYYIIADEEDTEEAHVDKPGYVEIHRYREEKAFIYLQNELWMLLTKNELIEARKMCGYKEEPCNFQSFSQRKKNITGSSCPEKCCMNCQEICKCAWACVEAIAQNIRKQSEEPEKEVVTEPDADSEAEESMELYEEICEQPEEEELTVPVDLEEEDVIDGEYREITEQVAISQQETPEEEKSAYGLAKSEYPKGSLLATAGCGHKHWCFSCAQHCDIRQEERYCREAPIGNPFSCTTMSAIECIREEVGDKCQFINQELATINVAGTDGAVPCCKLCQEVCGYRCQRAPKNAEQENEAETIQEPELDSIDFIKEYHREESKNLDEYMKVEGLPEKMVKRQQVLVAALANMIYELEETQEQEPEEQPELPAMKNQEQRKSFIDSFRSWPVWYQVPQASEVYYKYDLPDGSSIVVCEYRTYSEWKLRYKNEDPETLYYRYYLLKPGYHYLNDCKTNLSALVEHLKEVMKNG